MVPNIVQKTKILWHHGALSNIENHNILIPIWYQLAV
jgi:hypothetical protein